MLPPFSSARESRCLLVVDDQPSVRVSLEFLLGGEGFRVVTTGSGPEAIERMGRQFIDGALIDVHMPIMNGFETCQQLQGLAVKAGRPLWVWFMTGAGRASVEKRCVELGALGVLGKPFDRLSLIDLLENGFKSPALTGRAISVAS